MAVVVVVVGGSGVRWESFVIFTLLSCPETAQVFALTVLRCIVSPIP